MNSNEDDFDKIPDVMIRQVLMNCFKTMKFYQAACDQIIKFLLDEGYTVTPDYGNQTLKIEKRRVE